MNVESLSLRHATRDDLGAVDALLARSYPRLLKRDYPPSVIVLAVPIIARARPELLASGRYWVAEDAAGRVIGAGGWSGRAGGAAAEVRHVATDPDVLRRGVGRALMARVMGEARAAGFTAMDCLSTWTAVPFYASVGFRDVAPLVVSLGPGISFPVMRMICTLT